MARIVLGDDHRELIATRLTLNPTITFTAIAAELDCHPSTVSREVNANGGRDRYRPIRGARRQTRNLTRARPSKLVADPVLKARVETDLARGLSPEAVAADLRAEGTRACHETIYRAAYKGELDIDPAEVLHQRKRRRVHRHRPVDPNTATPVRPNISGRPASCNDRVEPGHWEADGVIGRGNKSAVLTLQERSTRFGFILDMPEGYNSLTVLAALTETFDQIPTQLRKTLTLDMGSEWARWPALAATFGLNIFFCDPHSPWQRGGIERFNGQVRFFFPRGTDLGNVGQVETRRVAGVINGQRRRILGGDSPQARYDALIVR
ncbi:MAG: IS30 family transposase [Microthrixaceae bacterium]|jgi:IS30 family transposase|nr:IS30 family transposase [Microthrixaceae bacterium]